MKNFSATTSVTIKTSVSEVWKALTEPVLVKKYFFNTNLVTDWKVGSPIFFRGEWDGKSYEDKGTVLSFEPEKSLSYNYWSPLSGHADNPEQYQVLRYDVEPLDHGVKISITQSNVDTQENADHSSSNWKMVLDGLKKMLEE